MLAFRLVTKRSSVQIRPMAVLFTGAALHAEFPEADSRPNGSERTARSSEGGPGQSTARVYDSRRAAVCTIYLHSMIPELIEGK
jgi:hypothetical protein